LKKLREIIINEAGVLGTNIGTLRHVGVSVNRAIGLQTLKRSVYKRIGGGVRLYIQPHRWKQKLFQKIGWYNNPKMTQLRQAMKGNIPVPTPLGVFKTRGGGNGTNYNRKPGNYVPHLRKTSSMARDVIGHHKQQGGLGSFKARGGHMKIQQKSWNRKPGL